MSEEKKYPLNLELTAEEFADLAYALIEAALKEDAIGEKWEQLAAIRMDLNQEEDSAVIECRRYAESSRKKASTYRKLRDMIWA